MFVCITDGFILQLCHHHNLLFCNSWTILVRQLPPLPVSKAAKLSKPPLTDEGIENYLAVACNGSVTV